MNPKEVFSILQNLNSKKDVQNLFTELNFEPTSFSNSEIDLTNEFINTKLKENVEYINLINEIDSFFIFFCKLKIADLNKGRVIQRELAKKISKKTDCIIVFSNYSENIFKITYVSVRSSSNIKLSSYTISKNEKLRTASEQIAKLEIGSNYTKADVIKHISDNKIFDIEPVTKEFFDVIKKYVDRLSEDFYKYFSNLQESKAFALQFFNRILFLKYIEKKKWLNNNLNFLEDLVKKYESFKLENINSNSSIYLDIFQPLFFYSFSKHEEYIPKNLSPELISELKNLPYLNGGLFEKNDLDISEATISDGLIKEIFSEIINKYNFTITEDTPFDREIAIDPEMLGLIYEGIVNSEERSGSGIFYTPRVEVDFMCKKSLLHFLFAETKIEQIKLINLIFSEHSFDEESMDFLKTLTLSERELITRALNNMKIIDPACGSGAFLIGMLQNIVDTFVKLENINLFASDSRHFEQLFKLKKDLIERAIHGVDIKPWAVQIAELRLWLYLIGDYEGSLSQFGNNPILPSLDFKIRCGDSLLSDIEGYQIILRDIDSVNRTNPKILRDVKELKDLKLKYYYHDSSNVAKRDIEEKEKEIIKSILLLKKRDLIREFELLYSSSKVADHAQLFESTTKDKIDLAKFKSERELKEKKLNEEIAKIDEIINMISEYKNKNYFIWELDFADVFFEAQKGGFDIVIGNPPYVRQEEIAPPLIEKDKVTIEIKSNYKNKLIDNIINIYGKEKINKFDKKSDYYVYFYFISLSLLKEKGIFTFINSTSWLDVGYGVFLQEFLLKNFSIIDIHDNSVKRSFKSADINTIIISIEKPDKDFDVLSNMVRFINHKTDFENSITLKNILEIYLNIGIINNEYFRMIIKSQKDLLDEGTYIEENEINYKNITGKYTGSKWGGKYLRAPDIYYKILEKGKGKLIPLKEVAEVRRGFTTGANEFFYVEPTGKPAPKGCLHVKNRAGWEGFIEEEFLQPIIFSLKEIKTYKVEKSNLKKRVIICNLPKNDLKDTSLLKYINYGEQNNFNQRPTCKSRNPWYGLGRNWKYASLIFPSKVGERMPVALNNDIYEDKKQYGITPKNTANTLVLAGILNSTLIRLIIELSSRQLTGSQAIADIDVDIVDNLLIPNIFNNSIITDRISKLFNILSTNKSNSIFIECGINTGISFYNQIPKPSVERLGIDNIIFDLLRLEDSERREVYLELCKLVFSRIQKANNF